MRRKKGNYFIVEQVSPQPVVVRVTRRVQFSEVDAMSVAWHGRYATYFEEAYSELGRQCGIAYADFFKAKLLAPIVQLHIDYHEPVVLDELIIIQAKLVWHEGARMNIEYTITRENGAIAATGYTVQMFVDAETQEPQIVIPPLIENCRTRWKAGEYACLT